MLDILGISMKAGDYYRVQVKATEEMNKAWLDIINEDEELKYSFEEAMRESIYTSNKEGYLVMEIEVYLEENEYSVVYYFDSYEELDVELTEEELLQCVNFINEWKDRLPDNDNYLVADCEWYKLIPDDIPWK